MADIIKLLTFIELLRVVSDYLSPIEIICLRNASATCRLLISVEAVEYVFHKSLSEGLKLWNLNLNELKTIMTSGNLYLSGSFLMHTMVRRFNSVGDIDLWYANSREKTTDSFDAIVRILQGNGYYVSEHVRANGLVRSTPQVNYECFEGSLRYSYDRFIVNDFFLLPLQNNETFLNLTVPNFPRTPSTPRLSLIRPLGDVIQPREVIANFDIDVVKMLMFEDLRCPLLDINSVNCRQVFHLLKKRFSINENNNNQLTRIKKYYAKGLILCRCYCK